MHDRSRAAPKLPVADLGVQADLRAAFEPAALAGLSGRFAQAVRAESAALAAGDAATAADAAHRLTSAAAQFGFPALAAAARAIERSLRAGIAVPAERHADLAADAEQALAAVRDLLAGLGGA